MEMQQNYESKLSQLQEECKILVQSQRQQHSYQNNLDKENEELKQSVKLLEDKYRQAEKELLGVIADLKNQLVQKNIELHEKEKLVEQKMHNHEKQVALTSSVSNEIQGLKENIKKAEEEIDNYKLKLEEAEQKYNAVVLKHKTLKEKVRKYHKFIHNKEKDFAYNLLKLNEEHKIALENVAAIKNHVTDVLEKKLGDLKSSFFQIMALKNLPESCPRYENKPEFLVESVKTKDSGQGCRKVRYFKTLNIDIKRSIHSVMIIKCLIFSVGF